MMEFVQQLVFTAALATVPAYAWRLYPCTWWTHNRLMLIFHVSLAWAAGGAGYAAAQGDAGLGHAAAVIAAIAWLAYSHGTWRFGPPSYTESASMSLDPLEHHG